MFQCYMVILQKSGGQASRGGWCSLSVSAVFPYVYFVPAAQARILGSIYDIAAYCD